MSALPDPFVPADVDLRDFHYMPLYFDMLFSSETWLLCNAEEKVAAMTLWCKAWHQTPAGSLPDNPRLLSSLAGYGVAVKAWDTVAPMALRGWVRCADGRLYHRFLASRVAISWLGKVLKGWGKECDRIRKENKDRTEKGMELKPIPPKPAINTIGFPPEVVALSDGNDGAFRRNGISIPQTQHPVPEEPPPLSVSVPAENPESSRAGSRATGTGTGTGTIRKKERTADAETAGYVFEGKVIRLSQSDFADWQRAFPNIPDIRAELHHADAWYADNPPKGGKWFHAAAGWLKKANADGARGGDPAGGDALAETRSLYARLGVS